MRPTVVIDFQYPYAYSFHIIDKEMKCHICEDTCALLLECIDVGITVKQDVIIWTAVGLSAAVILLIVIVSSVSVILVQLQRRRGRIRGEHI